MRRVLTLTVQRRKGPTEGRDRREWLGCSWRDACLGYDQAVKLLISDAVTTNQSRIVG